MVHEQNGSNLPQVYVQTPLIESVTLKKYAAGRRIYLKLENCQPSGSFKLRGIATQVKEVNTFVTFWVGLVIERPSFLLGEKSRTQQDCSCF